MITQTASPASANNPNATSPSPFLTHTLAAFRRAVWPWLYVVIFLFIQRSGANVTGAAWGVLQYLHLVASVAVAVFVILPGTSKSTAFLNAGIAFLLLFLPGFLNYLVSNSLMPYNINGIEHLIFGGGIASRAFYPVALGALIVAAITRRPLQWLAILVSPILLWPIWVVLVRHSTPPGMVFPNYYFIFSIVHVPIASLIISIPAAVLALMLWKPDPAVANHPSLASHSALLTREILLKELRLQKNNILFAVATFILGIIGLISVNATDPSVASFNVEDIRDALLSVILLPLLTLVLPLMIGSTAAAGEKAMGVQGWQTALPVSLRRVVALKFTVITGLLLIISGVLPYILSAVAVESTTPVNAVFRYTWPVWLAFLCAAMGYYSGTLARDDYQGLLISLGPITLLIVAMTYADPLRLVFPAYIGWQEPLLKQYLVAGRLLIIAAFFIISAMQLQRRPGQKKLRLIAAQAAILVIGTFILTLVNIVGERTVLYAPKPQTSARVGPYPRIGSFIIPRPILSIERASTQVRESIILNQDLKLPFKLQSGYITKNYGREYGVLGNVAHPFLVLPTGIIREFPQSLDTQFAGVSANGRWILSRDVGGKQFLHGPGGLTIHSGFLPRVWFNPLISAVGVKLTDEAYQQTLEARDFEMTSRIESKGSDLLVQTEGNRTIFLKDGATYIPNYYSRWYHLEQQRMHLALIMMPLDDSTTTQIATLKPLPHINHYEITSVATGGAAIFTSDLKWASVGTDYREIILRETQSPDQLTSPGTAAREYRIEAIRSQPDGTRLVLKQPEDRLQVMTVNGTPYVAWQYDIKGPVSIGDRPVGYDEWLGCGAYVLNLKTGQQHEIPFRFGWDRQTSMQLLENFREGEKSPVSWQHTSFAVHPDGAIAASYDNMVGIIKPYIGSWNPDEIHYTTAAIPYASVVLTTRFLTQDELLATDGSTLYQIKIPPTPKLRPN